VDCITSEQHIAQDRHFMSESCLFPIMSTIEILQVNGSDPFLLNRPPILLGCEHAIAIRNSEAL